MTPRHLALLLPCALLACERAPSPPRQPEPEASAMSFDNEAAARSIVRAEVIAETEPTPEPAASTAPAPPPGATVAFPSGAEMDDEARAALDKLVADPALPPDARFVVRGHSDSLGDDRRNLITSRRRAEAVRDYLVKNGVDDDRIEVIALGERRPIAPNATLDGADDPAGRARNRRVDVEVVLAAPAPSPSPSPSPGTSPSDTSEMRPGS